MSITKQVQNRAISLVRSLEERCYGQKTAEIVENLCDLYLEHSEDKSVIPGLQGTMKALGVEHAVSFSAVSARMFVWHRDKIYGKQSNTSGAKRGPKAKKDKDEPKVRVISVEEILEILPTLTLKDLQRIEKVLLKAEARKSA